MIITDHAARRYIRRLAPGVTLDAARALLARVSRHARMLPQRTDAGQQLWQTTGAVGAVLVVKHDPAVGPVVVTVLSEGQTREADDEEVDEVQAAFERQERAKEEQRRICEAERAGIQSPPPPPVVTYNVRTIIDAREAKRAAKKAGRARAKAEQAAGAAKRKAKRIAHEAKMKQQEREALARRTEANAARRRDNHAEQCARWAGVLP